MIARLQSVLRTTVALAYRDRGSDTYVTAQVIGGVERRDSGWRRWQLEAL